MDRRERCLGALYGHLCGDAFGVPYEFLPPERIPAEPTWRGGGSHAQPAGTWSDDGALMLCTVESLLACDRLDPEDCGARFVRWWRHGHQAAGGVVFDIGTTTRAALARLERGVRALEAGPNGASDNGNGSLMRILPLALWTSRDEPAAIVATAQDGSRLTHGHAQSRLCCALHNLLVARLLDGVPPAEAWAAAVAELRSRTSGAEAEVLERILAEPRRSGGGWVVDCLHSARESAAGAADYVAAVTAAVRLGHDTDTTACVAGGLAGAVFGDAAIPAEWRAGLRLSADQRRMLEHLAARAAV